MPIRYITVPSPVTLVDPMTGEALKSPTGGDAEAITFDDIIVRLMQNPMWGESYHNIKAQHEIMQAMSKKEPVLMLGEDDWQRLKSAAEFPKPNIGYNPVLVHQLLPLLSAIIDATTTDPRPKPAPAAKE